ncbi:MAG: Ku protein [Candidatus Dormibacteria bacterium]
MPRSMWRGAISFGMVAIPIRMYLATESKSVHFRLLCPNDHSPIKNKRWCPQEEREIAWNEAVRGYEVGKDEFVEIADSDLDELPLPSAHTIEILEFVEDHDIDAGVYIKSAYYLEPEAVGVKPYYLLKSALEKTGKVAIGKIALRDREHLCRLALHDQGLLLNTLHWPDEIRDAGELSLPEREVEVHKRELDMAVMLVDNLSASFDPARYRDEYREAVIEVVEAKLHDQPARKAPAAEPAKVTDLMAALRASVEASKSGRTAAEPEPALAGATAARAKKPAAPKRSPAKSGGASEAPVRRRKAS